MNTFEIKDKEINVEEIMSQIRENIQKRRASGAYDPKMEALINQPLQKPPASAGEGDIKSDLDYMNSHWDVHAEYSITSHRPVIGQLLMSGRQLIHGEVKRYVDLIAGKQTEFNLRVIRSLKNMLTGLENKIAHLDERIDVVDNRIDSRIDSVDNRIDGVDKRITEVNGNFDRKVAASVDEMFSVINNDIKNKAWLANLLDERVRENISINIPESQNDEVMNYFLFEEKHRGSIDLVKKRQSVYLEYFQNCQNVLDIGCGRGEFLLLLKENGIGARGIDINEDMIFYCQKNGLDVQKANALIYLQNIENKSLDGIFSSQVVEHLKPDELISLVKLCYDKMKYGTHFIAETINPLCITTYALFNVDLSHVKPVHPETIKFLLESVGFREIQIKFSSPHPDDDKLGKLLVTDSMNADEKARIEVMNRNINMLNGLLFGYQDYAVIAKK
jgi:O-antigen chain-terminating methyltransferase